MADNRERICEIILEMLNSLDEFGTYQTTKCYDKLEEWINQLDKEKHFAYWERNQLVRFLSTQYRSYLMRHPDSDKEWEDDWRWIVCINAPQGQMTWHIHDNELQNFSRLKVQDNDWDGHTTEEKYNRLAKLSKKGVI